MRSEGTRPEGARDEQQVARWVRRMFGDVAPRYDLLNHLLSLNIDRWWRSRTARLLRPVLECPGVRVLDLCCGSGDLMLAVQRFCPTAVLGADFSHPMLVEARRKIDARRTGSLLVEADALRLPVPDQFLDLVTAAFGFRNLANYRRGLEEIFRVLKPGGVAAILEFSTPPNPLCRTLYDFYSRRILPRIGGAISGSRQAYSYLPASVRRFPDAEELAAAMRATGFTGVRFRRMSFGIVALHTGTA